jgi:hypothetical protein
MAARAQMWRISPSPFNNPSFAARRSTPAGNHNGEILCHASSNQAPKKIGSFGGRPSETR